MLRLSLVLMLLFASPVRADFLDGNKLHETCNKETDFSFQGFCHGYIIAVADVMDDGQVMFGFKVCTPEGVKAPQLIDVVKRWLANNPQDRHYAADSLIAGALDEAFPC